MIKKFFITFIAALFFVAVLASGQAVRQNRATADHSACFGSKIEDSAFLDTTSETSVHAPKGYLKVNKRTNFRNGTYSVVDLSVYKEVKFATFYTANYYCWEDWSVCYKYTDGWVEWSFRNNGDGTWAFTAVGGQNYYAATVSGSNLEELAQNYYAGNEKENVLVTELRGELMTDVPFGGEIIAESALKIVDDRKSVGGNFREQAPYGYKNIKHCETDYIEFHGKNFSAEDLSGFKAVRFAIKGSGFLKAGYFSPWSISSIGYENVWTYVTLTRSAEKTWNLVAEQFGKRVYEAEHLFALANNGVYSENSLNALLYGGNFGFYPTVKNEGDSIYFTELRGVYLPKEIEGDVVDKKLINANGVTGEATSEVVPSGYTDVWEYTASGSFIHGMYYSQVPISDYSSVNFAVKTTGIFRFDHDAYDESHEWLYFTITPCGEHVWSVEIKDQDGVTIFSKNGLEGRGTNTVYTDDSLNAILYGYVSTGFYSYGDNVTMYFTEVRGTLKNPHALTKIIIAGKYQNEFADRTEDAIINYYAIKEAKKWLGEFAGVTDVEYVSDESTLSSSTNHIIMGNVFANGDYRDLTTDTGYKIVKRNGNVYLYGKTGYGTLNALYGLLKQRYNLEMYADTVYTFSDAGDICYEEIREETFNPSIDYNLAYDGPLTYIKEGEVNPNYDYQRRLGFVDSWQQIGGSWHSFLDYVPQSEYGTAHPEWYTVACYENGEKSTVTTLDLTTGGDAMAKVVADKIKAQVEADEAGQNIKPVYVFGPPDERVWSNSTATQSTVEQYKARSAEYVKFMNEVAKRLDDDYTFGRQIKLCLIAYNLVCDAPDYNAELEFYKGDEISLSVMFAPIEFNMYRAADDTTPNYKYHVTNAHFTEQLSKWKALGGEVYYWNYSEYYDNYFVMLDTITNMQSKYKLMAENGVNRLIDLGMVGDNYGTDFTALKIYLKGKLARNVNENVDALVKNFCSAYYGTGGEYIYSLLTSEQARYKKVSDLSTKANNGEDAAGIHVIREGVAVKSYWDENEFDTWYGYIKSALTAIENSGATEKTKTEYKKRVMREGIAVRYMKYYVFNSFVTLANGETDSISAMITDAKSVNITRFAEGQAYVWNESRSGWRQVDGRIDKLA